MTDPKFETREALEAWAEQAEDDANVYSDFGLHRNAHNILDKIARVKAAHAHLLKGQDDG